MKIGVVGLGYVGLPVAIAFGEKYPVIGFDINEKRIISLKQGVDDTGEVSGEELRNAKIHFTSDPSELGQCNFVIVSVPTPINEVKQPDLTALQKASETVGKHMSPGTVVVYESTVYPGATEEICIPILEQFSGMKAGKDFHVGYSPERINPGDKEHTFKRITKVVSGQNEYALSVISEIYGSVVDAGIYKAPSIKVAEASKVIENTQRDLNIALMNELAIIFNRLNIDTMEVLRAAGTKWNFLSFTPGLVGGHCIGVDPYYLTYKAQSIGYHPEVILAGRRINDTMGQYIATVLVKQMILRGIPIQGSVVTVMGLTFKENVTDIRNTKVIDIVRELQEYGIRVQVTDPLANKDDALHEYGIELLDTDSLVPAAAIVLAVPHKAFIESGWNKPVSLLADQQGIIIDVKSALDLETCPQGVTVWRL